MAIAHRATGTASFGVNSFTPAIPGSAALGDMMLLLCGGKPYNTDPSTPWLFLGEYTDGTTAAGSDTGSMLVQAYYKEHDGTESDPQITEGSPAFNTYGGIIICFSKADTDEWVKPVIVGGGDSSAGTGFSVATGSNPGITTGDHCVSFAAFRSDAATPCSSHITPSATGVTFSNTHDPSTDPEDTGGGDMGMCMTRSTVTGTSSGNVTLAATLATSHTGSALFVRLRVAPGRIPNFKGINTISQSLNRVAGF